LLVNRVKDNRIDDNSFNFIFESPFNY